MHVDPDLSAYLDGELAQVERARVEAHLGTCDRCADRLAELRATAALITALPYSRSTRSLVPAVGERWVWLRPIRSLSAVASGAFLFVFLLTAVARSGTGLGGGGATAAAPAPQASFGVVATAAPAPAAFGAPAAPTAVPAPGAVDQAQQRSTSAGSAAPSIAYDTAKAREAASPTAASAPQSFAAQRTDAVALSRREQAPNPLLDPRLWLALAIVAAALAIAAHMRLRTA